MIEVFRVGVHLGMTTNGPQVIGVLLRDLGLLHGSVDKLAEKWTKMKPLIGGAVAAFAGTAALRGMWDMVKAAEDLNKELNRTKQLGGEFAATIDQTRMTAFRVAGVVPTTAPSDNVKVQRELGAQMQNPQAAADILPIAQRTAFVISNFTGEKTDDIVKNLTKVAELRAQIFSTDANGKEFVDQAKVKTEFDAAMRALLLTGGFLKSNDLVQLAKQAGVPAKGMTPEAFYADAAEMSVSQGASRTGTALTSMYQQMVGGTMTRRVAEEMQRMGQFNPGDWSAKKGGAIVVQPEARQRLAAQIGDDPIAYITGPLNDRMTAMGMDSKAKLDEVFQMFGRQTTQRLAAEALSSGPLFERARHMFGTIPDADTQYKNLQKEDLGTNIKSFEAAWKGLMEALGEQGIPLAISVMQKLTEAMHAMTAWAVAHPEAVHNIEMTAAALSALAAVGGTLVVTAFGLRMVGSALSFMSSITGLTALGTGMRALGGGVAALAEGASGALLLASRLTVIGSAIGALIAVLKLGSSYETPETRKQQDDLNKQRRAPSPLDQMQPQDGYGVDGSPIRKQSFIAPPKQADQHITVAVRGEVDGRTLLQFVTAGIARQASGPSTGTTGFDARAGMVGGMQALA